MIYYGIGRRGREGFTDIVALEQRSEGGKRESKAGT